MRNRLFLCCPGTLHLIVRIIMTDSLMLCIQELRRHLSGISVSDTVVFFLPFSHIFYVSHSQRQDFDLPAGLIWCEKAAHTSLQHLCS